MIRIPRSLSRRPLSCLFMGLFSCLGAEAPVSWSFTAVGLSGIQLGEVDWLHDARIHPGRALLADGTALSNRVIDATYHPERKERAFRIEWGTLRLSYHPEPSGLRMELEILNQSGETIDSLRGITLLSLKDTEGRGRFSQRSQGVDGPMWSI